MFNNYKSLFLFLFCIISYPLSENVPNFAAYQTFRGWHYGCVEHAIGVKEERNSYMV